MTKKIKKLTKKLNEVFETKFRPWQMLLVIIGLAGMLALAIYVLHYVGTPNV